MEKIKVLIVEDQAITAMDISELLEKNGFEVSGICVSAEDVLPFLRKQRVDIILLDINLSSEKNGIELSNEIQIHYQIPYIFLTALADAETLKDVIKSKPAAYLNKPFKEVDLISALEIALNPLKENVNFQTTDLNNGTDYFFVKSKSVFHKILLKEIYWFEADRNYTHIITEKNKFTICLSIGNLLKKANLQQFIRIHRSYVVNLDLIDSFDDSFVHIQGFKLPITRNMYQYLVEKFSIN